MKDFVPEIKVREEQVIQAEEKRENLIGSLQSTPGLTLWEIEIETREVRAAEFEEVNVDIKEGKEGGLRKKLLMKKKCFYVEALNKKNALRKMDKQLKRNGGIRKTK